MLQSILLNKLVNCVFFQIQSDHEWQDTYQSDCLTPTDAVAVMLTIIADTGLAVKSFFVDFRARGTGTMDAKWLDC